MDDLLNYDELSASLREWLPGQRWFGRKDKRIEGVIFDLIDEMRSDWPCLLRLEADVRLEGGSSELYHILLGVRAAGDPPSFLEENSEAVIGDFETRLGPGYAYDALRDPELTLDLFRTVFPELRSPERVRPMNAEASNSLLIYDDAMVFKIFRSLSDKVNLDLEVAEALGRIEFPHVAAPLGIWRESGIDLGMVQPFLAGGTDGWHMALTSRRDMFGGGGDPEVSGGDFAAEARRLGATTAKLHGALAEAFGLFPSDARKWAEAMLAQLNRTSHSELDHESAARVFRRLAEIENPGPSIRVHGDFHLGQAIRTDSGWFILDFGGEPSRPVEERRTPTSPLKDVAGILRSLHYSCWTALMEQEREHRELVSLGRHWEQRNRGAFVDGYLDEAQRIGGLLPQDESCLGLILKSFELDRGIYEIGYEMHHRPDWLKVPLAQISTLY
jgi:maltokinase